jgi:hypothetical protein
VNAGPGNGASDPKFALGYFSIRAPPGATPNAAADADLRTSRTGLLMLLAISAWNKILLAIAVISAQALDINATQHILAPPYNGNENEFLAHPFVHPHGYAEQWTATLASDGIQYLITRRWAPNAQSALWLARAGAHLNAALQIQAQIRAFDAQQAQAHSTASHEERPPMEDIKPGS